MSEIKSSNRTRSQNAEFVIASIRELGIQPHPQSRLMRMHHVLTTAEGIIAPSTPEFETALEAERDMQTLGFVFDQIQRKSSDTVFRQLVKKAFKDSLLPQEDRQQSRGSDAQFELFIAAVCNNANLRPVMLEEPDVTFHMEGNKFGMAAKRIKSTVTLKQHIRKASEQIIKSGLPGIIALDTNVAFNRNNDRVNKPIPDNRFGLLYKQAINHFVSDYHDKFQDWVRGKGILCIVIHDQQVRYEPNEGWHLVGMTMYVNTTQQGQSMRDEFSLFQSSYSRGLANLENL